MKGKWGESGAGSPKRRNNNNINKQKHTDVSQMGPGGGGNPGRFKLGVHTRWRAFIKPQKPQFEDEETESADVKNK